MPRQAWRVLSTVVFRWAIVFVTPDLLVTLSHTVTAVCCETERACHLIFTVHHFAFSFCPPCDGPSFSLETKAKTVTVCHSRHSITCLPACGHFDLHLTSPTVKTEVRPDQPRQRCTVLVTATQNKESTDHIYHARRCRVEDNRVGVARLRLLRAARGAPVTPVACGRIREM